MRNQRPSVAGLQMAAVVTPVEMPDRARNSLDAAFPSGERLLLEHAVIAGPFSSVATLTATWFEADGARRVVIAHESSKQGFLVQRIVVDLDLTGIAFRCIGLGQLPEVVIAWPGGVDGGKTPDSLGARTAVAGAIAGFLGNKSGVELHDGRLDPEAPVVHYTPLPIGGAR